MGYPKIELAQMIVKACKDKKIKNIVISPGSRNAPLTNGFTQDDFFNCYSIVDERCAGFFALGISQQTKEPVAVVCTSGSALLNYCPAVSEAYYSNIPLVVISADRPSDKIDIGDGQTIHQVGALANHIRGQADLSDKKGEEKENEKKINKALNTAIEAMTPVHINAPFEEPLYEMVEKSSVCFENEEPKIQTQKIERQSLEEFIKAWNSCSKKMVVIGYMNEGEIKKEVVEKIKQDKSVVVLMENLANTPDQSHFSMIDTLLAPIEHKQELVENFAPEMVISVGNMVVSKKIKIFLRKNKPKYHFYIDQRIGYDSFFCLTAHLKMSVNDVFKETEDKLKKVESDYKPYWSDFFQKVVDYRQKYFKTLPYSDFMVYKTIFENIPNNTMVQISNSSPIRYSQFFRANPKSVYYCNRGTSGIDGSLSTAIGAGVASQRKTLFVTGDLSFFYNSNAMWCQYTPRDFKVIIINNSGGGIFRILQKNNNTDKFHRFFETKHNLRADSLAHMYGWEYQCVENKNQIEDKILDFLKKETNAPSILEIITPSHINDQVFNGYFSFLKEFTKE